MEPASDSRQDAHPCCRYTNHTGRLVILRCVGPDRFFHEKVIFPFEDWLFACPASGDVQIWTHGQGGAELIAIFSASDLLVEEVELPSEADLKLALAS